VHGPGCRRLRDRIESCPPDVGRREVTRRPERGRLRARDVGPARVAGGTQAARADDPPARTRRRARGPRRIDRGAVVKEQYEKPPELYDGLRLHQNENTGGCSPRVLDALARLTRQNLAYYPPYAE